MTENEWKLFEKGKLAVHCDTEEKASEFVKLCYDKGIGWTDLNGSLLAFDKETTYFERSKEGTAYTCWDGYCLAWGSTDYISKKYPIIKYECINAKSIYNPITPSHYNSTKITTFDVVNDWSLDFYLGNAIKYIQRAGKKDGNSEKQDLLKAIKYIEERISLLEDKE